MTINKTLNDKTLNVAVEGRLDTLTCEELDSSLKESMPSADKLILDFEKLDYISSAGLRVVLQAHKAMAGKGGMTLVNLSEVVREVFEVTGFVDILDIQ